MDSNKVIIAAIVIVFLVLLIIYLLKIIRMARLKTSNIFDCTDGEVEIKGYTKKVDNLLKSPYSGASCVCYDIKVEERVQSGKSSSWRKRYSKSDSIPFKIDDGTGEILVENKYATFDLRKDKVNECGTFNSADYKMSNFLKSVNIDPKGLFFNKNLRVTEKYLRDNERVYALGEASRASGSLKLTSITKKLIISDRTEDELVTVNVLKSVGCTVVIAVLSVIFFRM